MENTIFNTPANEYALKRIGDQYPLVNNEYRRRCLVTHDNFALEEAFDDGALYGYRKAMEICKEWMQNYFPEELDGRNFEFVKRETVIEDFESEMNKKIKGE